MSEASLEDILAIQDQVNEKMADMVHNAITKLTEKGVHLSDIDTQTPEYDPGLTYVQVRGVPVFRVCAVFFEDRISVAASWVPEGVDVLDEPDEEPGLTGDNAFAN